MANATIYSHPVSYLSWSSSSSVTSLNESSTTIVTNSSGDTVDWVEGTNSGSIPDTGMLTCAAGAAAKTWQMKKGGTVRITLTVTGGGGG
jgi:hypothetical protein